MVTPAAPPCALCLSPSVNVERLKADSFYCNVCGRCFTLDAEGHVIARHRTQHEPQRKTDVSHNVISGE
jgi:hypothetical protein